MESKKRKCLVFPVYSLGSNHGGSAGDFIDQSPSSLIWFHNLLTVHTLVFMWSKPLAI